MKIGIITFHRAHNYGAFLQCYALQTFLQKQGYDVSVIDYNNKELWQFYEWFKWDDVKSAFQKPSKIPGRVFRLLKKWKRSILRYYKFVWFQTHMLNLKPISSIMNNPYDLILIGSDQVWNLSLTNGFDPYYWGQFAHPTITKIASYAASLKSIWTGDDAVEAIKNIRSLDGVSLRETDVAKEIYNMDSLINPTVHIDPVFLLTAEDWKKVAKKPNTSEPFILFYQAMTSDWILDEAKKFAANEGKKLVILSADMQSPQSHETLSASPFDFIGWILYADTVITSSFHATAFSLLFHKEFYCINLNQGKDSRVRNVLVRFSQEERFIQCVDDVGFVVKKQDDSILDVERKYAIDYVSCLLKE